MFKGRFQQLANRLKLPVPPARALFPAREPLTMETLLAGIGSLTAPE